MYGQHIASKFSVEGLVVCGTNRLPQPLHQMAAPQPRPLWITQLPTSTAECWINDVAKRSPPLDTRLHRCRSKSGPQTAATMFPYGHKRHGMYPCCTAGQTGRRDFQTKTLRISATPELEAAGQLEARTDKTWELTLWVACRFKKSLARPQQTENPPVNSTHEQPIYKHTVT